jgi:energy-coupling factor transport system permease protein
MNTVVPPRMPSQGAAGSWLARLSPIPKLAWLLAVLCVAFVTYHPLPLLVISAVALALALAAGVGRAVAAGLLLLAPLAASIVVVQSTAPGICGACTPAASLGPITIYQEGLARAASLIARVLAMEISAIVVFATTRPSDLAAALRRLRLPYTLVFMVSMTLELVPVLRREVSQVLAAQQARAMRRQGFAAVIPAFVPVFAGTLERMQLLAVSLESRGFSRSGPRTSFRQVGFGALDRGLTLAAVVAGGLGVLLGLTAAGADQVPVVQVPGVLAMAIVLVAAIVFAGVVLTGFRFLTRL